MFRISHFMQMLRRPAVPAAPARRPSGPVVIWNLVRRCNLTCRHCYSISADIDFPGELSTAEALAVLDDLAAMRVPALILSGGEPLLRPDLPELAARAKALGLYLGLSTNGTLIDATGIDAIAAVGYDYVGISIDGLREAHDRFRRMEGAFDRSLAAVRLCRSRGIKVGLRFTLTRDNADELPALLELMRAEGVDKFYLSHLNYAGRGARNRRDDAAHRLTRAAMDLLFDTAWADLDSGREYVSGNNDADGPYLLAWAEARGFDTAGLRTALERWGGNSTGVGIANIDNVGDVHPDTYWWGWRLGNVRERPFSAIWTEADDPLMRGLRASPRPLKGRCGVCRHRALCNGNTRVRAWQTTGDPWAEDPGCYLSDAEIGLPEGFVAEPPQPWQAAEPVRFDPARRRKAAEGEVWLVGAGPGDAELLTLKAARRLAEAEVIVYDRLVSDEVLAHARPSAERIYVGKADGRHTLPQAEINRLLVRLARQGRKVLRLKGGDPLIFGRGGEELEALRAAGIRYEVVPGITSAAGCAAYAGIPLTHRDHAQALGFVTGHRQDGGPEPDWDALARPGQTLVFYMGLHNAAELAARLLAHGCAPGTPAALIERGTTPRQRVALGTLAGLPELARDAEPPALIVIGAVAALHARLAWFEPTPSLPLAGEGGA